MTRPAIQCSRVLADFIDGHEADVADGCRESLYTTVALIDAELIDSLANGPTLWRYAKELRQHAEAQLEKLEADRASIAKARRAGPARLVAAIAWHGANWLDAFRVPEAAPAHEGGS